METDRQKKIKELLERAGKQDIELRTTPIEFRVVRKDDGSLPKIEGYASVFDSDSEDMGFIERIKPGAFKGALKISDSRALFNHDPNIVLGRQSAGTLELKEDKKGLWMSINPPDTQLVRDMVLTPIERGDVREQSFGFTIEADEWKDLDTDKPLRTITMVRELFDVSPVTYPAYHDTSVALRSLEKAKADAEDVEILADVDGTPVKKEYPAHTVFITPDGFPDGEETKEFSLNDRDEINRWLTDLTEKANPKIPADPQDSGEVGDPKDDDLPEKRSDNEEPDDADERMDRMVNFLNEKRN
jgi:hypothetical protein